MKKAAVEAGLSEGDGETKRRNGSDLFFEWTAALMGFSLGGQRGRKMLK